MSENVVREVQLPPGAGPPLRVWVNGEERHEGEAWTLAGGTLRFDPPLRARPKLGFGRSIMLSLGIGVYGDLRGDTLDVQFRAGGATRTATLPVRPPGGAPPG
jgi:hypothetical protein